MKKFIPQIAPLFLLGLLHSPANAQLLPSMQDQPWLGYFSGYERRDFHFGVNNEGQCALYLMKTRRDRASHTKTIKIYTELMVENAQGKRFYKRLKEDEGFATKQKAGLDHKEVTFTAESSGDAKVQINVKYEGNRIIMDGKILDRGKLKDGKLFLGFKVMMPSFYHSATYGKDKDKAKAKMRRDKFRLTRADNGKRESLKVYEDYDFTSPDLGEGKITALEVDMDAQEGKTFLFTTLDRKGVFQLDNRYKGKKAPPWKGYYVKWYRPMTEEKGKEIKPFIIEVK